MLPPKKKAKKEPIQEELKTGIDVMQYTSQKFGKGRAAKNILPMGSFFGLLDSFQNDLPYKISDVVGVIPTNATQIASLVLDYAEKENQNFKDFAKNKNRGKKLSEIKPEKELNTVVTESTEVMKKYSPRKRFAQGTGMEGLIAFLPGEGIMQETPAQKALREKREARAKLEAEVKAKNAARLAPLEAARAARAAAMGMTLEEYNAYWEKNAKAEDAVLEGLQTNKANKRGKTKGSCTTGETMGGDSVKDIKACGTGPKGLKKYAQGTGVTGMDPNHYIISPAEALNDYNIMLAKAEAKSNASPWLPVAAIAGQALQTGIGIAGKYAMKNASVGSDDTEDDENTKAAMGMNNVQKDVEVEGGEMFETPQGNVGEFKGPSHEQGGIPLELGEDVEEGTKVYSDRLKIGKKTLAERKATRERQIANLEKIASDNLADAAVKNAAKRKMQAIQKEEAADLDFQEKVNNIQTMADVMVKAFGTGMSGVQKYANGTDGNGIDPSTKEAFDAWYYASASDGTLTKKYPNYKEADFSIDNPVLRKDFQSFLFKDKAGTKDTENNYSIDGAFGKTTNAYAKDYLDLFNKMNESEVPSYTKMYSGWKKDDTNIKAGTYKAPAVAGASGVEMDLSVPVDPLSFDWKNLPEVPAEVMLGKSAEKNSSNNPLDLTATKKEPSKLAKTLEDNIPAVGDVTKLIGNYLGMTAGIKTAAEQRSTDVTHTNVFANAGEESQRLLDNAKQGIETSKAQAIVKASTVGRGGKRGARGSARGVNQMRATDWLYDTALQQQIAEISANAAQQISGIDTQKSSVAMSADQLKGQGEYQAAMANEAAKDAYYTALGLGRKDFAAGVQQTGSDLNDMKENKIIENLMKNYGTYVTADKKGNLVSKTRTTKEQIVTDAEGIKYKVDKDGKLIKLSK